MESVDVSLIVASRNRVTQIKDFLSHMSSNSPNLNWELIIVDNGSSISLKEALKVVEFSKPLRFICEPEKGKSRAINRGLVMASGQLIVFTDDDVEPNLNWLEDLWKAFNEYSNYDVYGGPVIVDREGVPVWILKSYNLQELLLSEHIPYSRCREYDNNVYPIGPNMAIRKSAVTDLENLWDVSIGPGTSIPVGDERAMLSKLSMPGDHNRLFVNSPVKHEPEYEELTFFKVLKRCYLGGYSAGMIDAEVSKKVVSKNTKQFPRVLGIKSIREFLCVSTRAIGYFYSVLSRRFIIGRE